MRSRSLRHNTRSWTHTHDAAPAFEYAILKFSFAFGYVILELLFKHAFLEFSLACEYVIPELPSQHAIQDLHDTTPKSNALSTTVLATHKSTISLALSDLVVVSPQLWMDLSLFFVAQLLVADFPWRKT